MGGVEDFAGNTARFESRLNYIMQITTAPMKAIAPSQFTERNPKLLSPTRLNAGILKLPSLTTVTAMNRAETNAIKTKANMLMLILNLSISHAARVANTIFSANYLRLCQRLVATRF
jgi:hypothetical protein